MVRMDICRSRAEQVLASSFWRGDIAPLLGILRQMARENDTRPGIIVYGNRTAGPRAREMVSAAFAKQA